MRSKVFVLYIVISLIVIGSMSISLYHNDGLQIFDNDDSLYSIGLDLFNVNDYLDKFINSNNYCYILPANTAVIHLDHLSSFKKLSDYFSKKDSDLSILFREFDVITGMLYDIIRGKDVLAQSMEGLFLDREIEFIRSYLDVSKQVSFIVNKIQQNDAIDNDKVRELSAEISKVKHIVNY